MSMGKSDQTTKSNSQSSSTGTQSIDPTVFNQLQQAYQNAQSSIPSTYTPVSASQIQGYENPYTQSVIDTTNADLQRQNQIANVGNDQAATAQGAFGGSRSGVAEALTNEGYARQMANTDAALNNQNYNQAAQMATQQNAAGYQYPLELQQTLDQLLGLNVAGATKNTSASGTQSGTQNTQGMNWGLNAGGLSQLLSTSTGGGGTAAGDILTAMGL